MLGSKPIKVLAAEPGNSDLANGCIVRIIGRRERINAIDELDPLRESVARLHEANNRRFVNTPLNGASTIGKAN